MLLKDANLEAQPHCQADPIVCLQELDAIFVAIGGGGIAAGICAYVKRIFPKVRVSAAASECEHTGI